MYVLSHIHIRRLVMVLVQGFLLPQFALEHFLNVGWWIAQIAAGVTGVAGLPDWLGTGL